MQTWQHLAIDVKKSAAKRGRQPLVAAAGEEVHRSFANVNGHGPQLLDRIHDEPDTPLSAKLAESSQIATVAVAPLHTADGDDSGSRGDAFREIFYANFAIAIGNDVDFDTVFFLFHPGNGDLEKFQVRHQDAIAFFERN